mmetsp:Transcript_102022/g.327361  ORF Transcript_102022/g.327361 Transcript_102022/m.327361 type:complete len:529 (+) Transcript_102022:2090-3676(+)
MLGAGGQRHATRAQLAAARYASDREHHLAGGGEGDLQLARVLLGHILGEADFAGRDDDRGLGGIALGLPLLLARLGVLNLRQGGVAAEHSRQESRLHAQLLRGLGTGLRVFDFADGGVEALSFDGVVDATSVHVDHGHLALGQSAGLVTADHGGGSEGLHGGELPDEHVLADHVLTADGQGDSDAERDALRNGGHGQGHGDEDHVQPGRAVRIGGVGSVHGDADDEDDDADADGHDADAATQLLQAVLQRRGARGHVRQTAALLLLLAAVITSDELCDAADPRAHACGDDDALALAVRDAAAGEAAILRREFLRLAFLLGLHLPRLRDIVRLAGQGHLGHLDVLGLDEAEVRGHDVASAQDHDVALDDVGHVHLDLLAVTDNVDRGLGHLGEGLKSITGLVLSPGRDAGIDHDNDEDRLARGVRENVAPIRAGAVHDQGGDRRHHQENDHEARELHDEEHQEGGLRRLLELVGTIPLQNMSRLLGREALVQVGIKILGILFGGPQRGGDVCRRQHHLFVPRERCDFPV